MKTFKIQFEEADSHLHEAASRLSSFLQDLGEAQVNFEARNFEPIGKLSEIESSIDVVMPALAMSPQWLPACPVLPVKVRLLGAADWYRWNGRSWEPELLIEKALHQAIIHEAHHLDIQHSAYVIGEGILLRVAASVAFGLGYRRVYLVSEIESDMEEQKAILERVYIGAEVIALPIHELTLQTVGSSLLLNTFDLKAKPDLATDLAYFNFMKRGGVVLDLYESGEDRVLLTEAHRAGLRVIPAWKVWAARDRLMISALSIPVMESDLEALWESADPG